MKYSVLNKNFNFTNRELDVMACLLHMDGGSTPSKKIAKHLNMTPKRVDTIVHNILNKIHGNSRYDIVDFIEVNNLKPSFEANYHQLTHTEHVSSFYFLKTTRPYLQAITKYASPKTLATSIIVVVGLFTLNTYKWVFFPQHHATATRQHLQRSHLIETIKQTLRPSATVALVGPGGSGKTTLAHLYVKQSRVEFIKYINAESPSTLLTSFKSIAECLISHNDQRQKLQNILNQENPTHDLIEFVYTELEKKASWLLVFDNVDDFALCRRFLPFSTYQGRILITTRDQNIQNTHLVSSIVYVGELSLDEACELFTRLLPSYKENRQLKEFVTKLPLFPLDISLAAYYIRDARLTLDQYLDKLKKHQPTFHEHEQKLWAEVSEYPQTRYAIVGFSVEHLLKQNPQYLDLLWIIASVDSQCIPTSILSHTPLSNMVDALLHDLRKFSLIEQETIQFNHHMMSLHRSTQDILKHYLNTYYSKPTSDIIASSLTLCAQNAMEEGDALTLQKLIPHFEVIEKTHHHPHLHSLLGMLYYHAGRYVQAKSILEQDLEISQPTETTVEMMLKRMIYLSNTYKELGDIPKAEAMLQQALHFCQKRFANEPAKAAKLLVSIAQIYHQLGDFPKAEKLCDQSLEICHKCASTDYDALATIHMALCVTCREQGHYKKAEEHIHQSLSLYEKYLPNQHLDYAHALRLLGHVCSDEGRYQHARELYEKSLDIFLKHDQPNHPKVLWLYTKLGIICRHLGEEQKAHEYLDQAEHSNVFSTNPVVMGLTYHERAHLYIQQAHYDKAVEEARKSLDVYTQLYGEQHVKTRRALNLVGYTLMHQGTLDEAETCLLKAFQTFGEKELSLKCQSLDYLSELYRRKICLGNKKQAEELRRKSLDYTQQAIEITLQYFPDDSEHLKHLNRQKENIMRSQPGYDILFSKEYKRCQ